jgi:hypothetical protein
LVEKVEYDLFRQFFADIVEWRKARGTGVKNKNGVIVSEHTYPLESYKNIADVEPKIDNYLKFCDVEVIADYFAKNEKSFRLEFDKETIPVSLVTLEKDEMPKELGGPYWDELYKKHPGTFKIYEVSRVGFTKQRTMAMFYTIETWRGHRFGTMFFYKRDSNGWSFFRKAK